MKAVRRGRGPLRFRGAWPPPRRRPPARRPRRPHPGSEGRRRRRARRTRRARSGPDPSERGHVAGGRGPVTGRRIRLELTHTPIESASDLDGGSVSELEVETRSTELQGGLRGRRRIAAAHGPATDSKASVHPGGERGRQAVGLDARQAAVVASRAAVGVLHSDDPAASATSRAPGRQRFRLHGDRFLERIGGSGERRRLERTPAAREELAVARGEVLLLEADLDRDPADRAQSLPISHGRARIRGPCPYPRESA
jgi:hypothetical protein